jgi:hypothetical protein
MCDYVLVYMRWLQIVILPVDGSAKNIISVISSCCLMKNAYLEVFLTNCTPYFSVLDVIIGL